MAFLEKAKHKAKVIFNNIKSNPAIAADAIGAAAFGIMVGGQLGFNISIIKEMDRFRKAHDALVVEHLNFVEFFNKQFLPKARYNDNFSFEMIEVMAKELDTVKPGAYDIIAKAADDFDRANHGPCYPA